MQATGPTNPTADAFKYWQHNAKQDPEAQALAERLNLDLPEGMHGFKAGLMYPIRRLIVTGQDTPRNFQLLFGSPHPPELHHQTRLEVLAVVPNGSPLATVGNFMDEDCPRWTPRPPSEEEQASLRRLRDFSAMFARSQEAIH